MILKNFKNKLYKVLKYENLWSIILLTVVLLIITYQYTQVNHEVNEEVIIVADHLERPIVKRVIEEVNEDEFTHQEEEEENFRYYEEIPLSRELQEYIWTKSELNGISYELVLAIAKVESNFDPSAVSSTQDFGLMQLNKPSGTMKWLAEQAEIENFNWSNPKHSVEAAVTYLGYLKQHWLDKGLDEETARKAMLISYNRGLGGSRTYIRNNGYSNEYANKVLNYKSNLENSL